MGIKNPLFSKKIKWKSVLFLLLVFSLSLAIFSPSTTEAEPDPDKDTLEDNQFKDIYTPNYWKWDFAYRQALEEESESAGSVNVRDLKDIMHQVEEDEDYEKPPIIMTNDTHRGFLGNFLVEENDDVDGLDHRHDIPFYYHLDIARGSESNTKFWQVGKKAANMIETGINETVMMINDGIFNINVTLSMLPVGTLEMVDDFSFVSDAIDEIETKVQDLFGIDGANSGEPTFSPTGLMYNVIKILAMFVVIYAFFQFVWKRSFISSFGEMGKFILVLAIGLLLMANYAPFLKGMNDISNELSMLLVNQGSDDDSDDFDSQLDKFSDQMWNMFVDAPYLSLQYGTERINEIENTYQAYESYNDRKGEGEAILEGLGVDVDELDKEEEETKASNHRRVLYLLTTPAHTPQRKAMVKREAMILDNGSMSYDGVNEKTILNVIYFISSAIMSIPFLIIALAILFTHLWFVLMAMVAPFAFIVAAVPGQFNVVKRYAIELSMPLMVKIALHFILLMIMFMHGIINDTIEAQDNGLFSGRIGEAFLRSLMYFLMFVTVFFLRGRLANLFTAGSTLFQEMRQGVSDSVKPVQSGVTAAGTAVGAGAGLAAGSAVGMPLLGASAGANLGGTAGSTATGASTPSEGLNNVAQTGMHLAAQRQRQKQTKQLSNNNNQENNKENEETNDNNIGVPLSEGQTLDQEQAKVNGYENTMSSLEDRGVEGNDQEIYMNAMESEGVDFSKVDDETIDRNFTDDVKQSVGPTGLRAKKLAKNISLDHANQMATKDGIKDRRNAKFDDYLSNQGMSGGDIHDLRSGLQNNGIDTAHVRSNDLRKADNEVRQRLDSGENLSYKQGMQQHITAKTNNRMEQKKLNPQGSGTGNAKVPNDPINNGTPVADLETPRPKENASPERTLEDDKPPSSPPPENKNLNEEIRKQQKENRDKADEDDNYNNNPLDD